MTNETVLAWARSQDYTPGQNIRSTPMGALHLLLQANPGASRNITWVGTPTAGDRATIRAVLPDAHLEVVAGTGELRPGSSDLLIVTDRRLGDAVDAGGAATLLAARRPSGTVIVECRRSHAEPVRAALAASGGPGVETAALAAFPDGGPVRAVVPIDDPRLTADLARRGLLRTRALGWGAGRPGPTGGTGLLARIARTVLRRYEAAVARVAGAITRGGAGPRRSLVVAGPQAGRVPAYLASAAAPAVDLERARWALAAPGDYPSQKVLWFLEPPTGDDGRVLAKMTRDPRFSDRLRHAHAALVDISSRSAAAAAGVPAPVFAGSTAGLAIAAERDVSGELLGSIVARGTGGAAVDATLEWFVTLAGESRQPASPQSIAAALGDMLTRLERQAPVGEDLSRVLRAELAAIAALDEPIPLVMQHGDPGVNNVIARPGGGICVLDWENADRIGMPLWDVLYFVRSVAVAGRRRSSSRLDVSLQPFIEPGPLADLLHRSVQRVVARIALPPAAIGPLVLHCWVQQALKETTRLPTGGAETSIFLRFLRRLVASRDRPGYRRLVGTGA